MTAKRKPEEHEAHPTTEDLVESGAPVIDLDQVVADAQGTVGAPDQQAAEEVTPDGGRYPGDPNTYPDPDHPVRSF